jgi:predicted ATPase/DNA-binding winged helix-turn-helix (wHTH) protein
MATEAIDQPPDNDGETIAFGPFTVSPALRLVTEGGQPVRLGSRAFDILLVLIESVGEVVGKDELLKRVWGRIFVDEANLRVHINTLRKALGDGQNGRRFIVNIPGRGYSLVAPVRKGGAETAAPQAAIRRESPPGLIAPPAPQTRVIGREQLIGELARDVLARRFVSLAGPGGIGKTTVALSVAQALRPDFPEGIAFVDLAPIKEPRMVQSAVAAALNLPIKSDNEGANIVAALAMRRVLLLLDNCEHVVDAVASLAEQIHARAPQVHLMTTTREPLRVAGEKVYRIAGLESPSADTVFTAAEAASYSAVQLFVERAAAQAGGFSLTDANAAEVSEICRRLDGLALAIELAAARVDSLGLANLAARLDQRFQLLSGGRRTALPRQQTLRLTLDWSHDLLTEPERVVLRRLSVFAGSFTLEAAEAVAGTGDLGAEAFLDILSGLVLKSLVSTDTGTATFRYRLLDSTRAYAAERLAEHQEAGRFGRQHARHFQDELERFRAEHPAQTLTPLRPDVDNVRAALDWAFSPNGDPATGVRLAVPAAFLFIDLSMLAECARWTKLALDQLDEADRGSHLEMELSTSYAMRLLFTRGNLEEVRVALDRALALAEALGDVAYQARTLDGLYTFHLRAGQFQSMFAVANRAGALTRKVTLRNYGGSDWMLGVAHYFGGDLAEARVHLERALTVLPRKRSVDTLRIGVDHRVNASNALARALWMQGFAEQASAVAADNVEEVEILGDPVTIAVALMWTLPIALWTGDMRLAERRLRRLIECSSQSGLLPSRLAADGFRGVMAIRQGDGAAGVALLERSLEGLRSINSLLLEVVLMGHLAEGYHAVRRYSEAIATIDRALSRVKETGEAVNVPHLLHLRANSEWAARADAETFERQLQEARGWALRQGAVAYELRVLMDLVTLRDLQGQRAEGRAQLRTAFGQFEEGFATADLQRARRLLAD